MFVVKEEDAEVGGEVYETKEVGVWCPVCRTGTFALAQWIFAARVESWLSPSLTYTGAFRFLLVKMPWCGLKSLAFAKILKRLYELDLGVYL